MARALANELRNRLQRQYVVDNRPGAGGNIAAAAVAKADADLSTLLLCYTSHAINPSLFSKLPFDPVKDFTPLSLIARSPLLLVARPEFPANNLRELLALIKANPGKHSIGIAGRRQRQSPCGRNDEKASQSGHRLRSLQGSRSSLG